MPDSETGLNALEALTLEEPVSQETPPVATPPETPSDTVDTAPIPAEPVASSPEAPILSETPQPEPFALMVDGKPLKLEGIVKRDGKIEIPESLWDAEISKKYLANRETWGQKEAGYRRKLAELDSQVKAEKANTAKASIDGQAANRFVKNLIDTAQQDPVKFAETLDRMIAELPVKLAEAKLALIEERDTQTREQQAQAQREQEEAEADAQLATFLETQVRQALGSTYKELAPKADDVVAEMIGVYGAQVLAKLPTSEAWQFGANGWQVLGQVGDFVVGFSPDKLTQILDGKVGLIRTAVQREQESYKAKQRNQAAVAPTPPPVKPGPARNELGEFAPKPKPKGRKLLEELTME